MIDEMEIKKETKRNYVMTDLAEQIRDSEVIVESQRKTICAIRER